jgi:hypothetical protein
LDGAGGLKSSVLKRRADDGSILRRNRTKEARVAATEIDAVRAEAFAGRALQILNDAMLSLLLSVGHQTELLDTMAERGPVTSDELAQATTLDESYVREWLAGMTVGGIVEHDPDAKTYVLPPEHAACLTRAAGPDNLASFAQYTALFGELEQRVVECFREGGGVDYSEMPRFQALQAEESAQDPRRRLIEVTLPEGARCWRPPRRLGSTPLRAEHGSESSIGVRVPVPVPGTRTCGWSRADDLPVTREGVRAWDQDLAALTCYRVHDGKGRRWRYECKQRNRSEHQRCDLLPHRTPPLLSVRALAPVLRVKMEIPAPMRAYKTLKSTHGGQGTG